MKGLISLNHGWPPGRCWRERERDRWLHGWLGINSIPSLGKPLELCHADLTSISQSVLKLMSIQSVMPSNHLILCCPFLLLPSLFPRIRVFSSESALHIRWPKYWSFSFSISPSNEYSGLISFRIDRFDLLTVQGTLKGHILSHWLHQLKFNLMERLSAGIWN